MAFKLWNSASNDWSWAGSFTPSGVPVSNDEVTVPKSATVAPRQGMSQGAVDLDALRIEPGCMFDIGSENDPLVIGADLVVHQGWGTLNMRVDAPLKVDQLVIDSPNWENACTIGIVDAPVDALYNYERVTVLRGKLFCEGGNTDEPVIDFLEVGYRNVPQGDAIIDFSAGHRVHEMLMNAGVVKLRNRSTTDPLSLYQSGGRVEFVDENDIFTDGIAQSGGSLDMRGYPSAGTNLLNSLVMMGGVQTWLNDPRPKTIAGALIMPGASLLLPSSVTITSGGSMVTPPIAA